MIIASYSKKHTFDVTKTAISLFLYLTKQFYHDLHSFATQCYTKFYEFAFI